jgi:hypothetical protein
MTLFWLGLGLLAVIGAYLALEMRSVRKQRVRLSNGDPHTNGPDISRDQRTNQSIIESQGNQMGASQRF